MVDFNRVECTSAYNIWKEMSNRQKKKSKKPCYHREKGAAVPSGTSLVSYGGHLAVQLHMGLLGIHPISEA